MLRVLLPSQHPQAVGKPICIVKVRRILGALHLHVQPEPEPCSGSITAASDQLHGGLGVN